MMETLSLNGKVAIVSGSSSGIGAAIARELSRRGANIILNYPTHAQKEDATSVLESLRQGTENIAVEADLSTWKGPQQLAEAAGSKFGKIDILVNNAGWASKVMIEDVNEENWNRTINLNARGTLLLTQAVLPHLSQQNSRIVNIIGAVARDPQPGMTLYAGSKGMIDSFTRTWARELPRRYGCTVNSVAPGPVDTPLLRSADPEFMAKLQPLLDMTPVAPRMAKAEEVAYAVAMLCEEGASWVCGNYIVAGGGFYLG
jgi:NAD(P)-dependent dehydrogenase (short-subunit alcohol dehydrogenase family)